ncbi:MAG: hypothetical protein KatS3mg105_0497 [Gemmatales bacterium]|nr:MAG: hypothetical protein KatS3mg105_0497 [Gemmatales bacterium]
MLESLKRFLRDEEGPTAVEYAVMIALIILVCFAAVMVLGKQTSSVFANEELSSAIS